MWAECLAYAAATGRDSRLDDFGCCAASKACCRTTSSVASPRALSMPALFSIRSVASRSHRGE